MSDSIDAPVPSSSAAASDSGAGICQCSQSIQLACRHAGGGVLRTIIAFLIPGLLFAVIWGVVDYFMKFNPVQPPPLWLPFTASYQQISAGQQMSDFDRFVDTYNVLFPGACRFGSGIGMVLGGFWSVAQVRKNCICEKVTVGIFAGGLLGSRIMLMATSLATPCVWAFFAGAAFLPVYLLLSRRLYPWPNLPPAAIDPRFLGE